MKVTTADFNAAKKQVKTVGVADASLAHRTAIEALTARCPRASAELIGDMAWQVVLSAR
jgi:hypothetical protein